MQSISPVFEFVDSTPSAKNEFINKWRVSAAYTMQVVRLMPEELLYFQPTGMTMQFNEQLIHMADNINFHCTSFLEAVHYRSEKPKSFAEYVNYLQGALDYGLGAISAFDEFRLGEKLPFVIGQYTAREVIMNMHDHLVHHRAQLTLYLRLNGIEPPIFMGE